MTQTLRGWFSELRKYFLTNFVLNLIYSIQLKKLAHFRVLTFKTRDGVHFRIPHPLPHKTLTITVFIYACFFLFDWVCSFFVTTIVALQKAHIVF